MTDLDKALELARNHAHHGGDLQASIDCAFPGQELAPLRAVATNLRNDAATLASALLHLHATAQAQAAVVEAAVEWRSEVQRMPMAPALYERALADAVDALDDDTLRTAKGER